VNAFLSKPIPAADAIAVDFLQRAMLHFTLTAYKYQTDELNNKLISTGWFWINQLIQYLNRHADDFPE
jgi:hypothetical protein